MTIIKRALGISVQVSIDVTQDNPAFH